MNLTAAHLTSFAAPPMPYQPEELYKHVKILEEVYLSLPDETNRKQAIAKAIIGTVASFLEGYLQQKIDEIGAPKPIEGMFKRRTFVEDYLKNNGNWKVVENDPAIQFVRNDGENDLRKLRNKIDHGAKVDTNDLHLDNISFFRESVSKYIQQLSDSFKTEKPGWLI